MCVIYCQNWLHMHKLNFHVHLHLFLDYLSAGTLYATPNKCCADQIIVCCQEPVSLIQTVFWWGKVWGSSAYPGNCPEFCSTHIWLLIIWFFISVIFCFYLFVVLVIKMSCNNCYSKCSLCVSRLVWWLLYVCMFSVK